MNELLKVFVGDVLGTQADLVSTGMDSVQALNIASFPSELRAFRDTIRQMPTNEPSELINRSKGIPVSIQGYKGVFELTGIDPTEGMVFEYSDFPLGVKMVRLPIYEMDYNKLESIKRVIMEVL